MFPLHWRHNDHGGVSNHQPHGCLLNRLFRSKKTSKLRVTGLCVGNSPGTGEFPAQMASNAENVSIWWRHHALMRGTALANRMRQSESHSYECQAHHPERHTYKCVRYWFTSFNSLAPGRFQFNFRSVIFKIILVNGGWGISYEIALRR